MYGIHLDNQKYPVCNTVISCWHKEYQCADGMSCGNTLTFIGHASLLTCDPVGHAWPHAAVA
jgi:hypothetical protein